MIDRTLSNSDIVNLINRYENDISRKQSMIDDYQALLIDRKQNNKIINLSDKRNKKKNKPLLGLFNKTVYSPTAFCKLKCIYLLSEDIKKKKCFDKGDYRGCKHLRLLSKTEKEKGIKNQYMKFYDYDCEK
jgi:hypothetical protein